MHGQKSLDTALNVISNRPIHMKIAKIAKNTQKAIKIVCTYVHYLSFICLLLSSFFENVTNAWKLLVIHHLVNGKSDEVMPTLNHEKRPSAFLHDETQSDTEK